ncbi:hypothetical protein [Haloplanus halobius]|uniref:hypothetical protein n=1 Tax=Haloplanus halobius TaxID=2934938 RepID=UPI00200CB514|nr:hypothetical protein [Haloplanus sp. XH21]
MIGHLRGEVSGRAAPVSVVTRGYAFGRATRLVGGGVVSVVRLVSGRVVGIGCRFGLVVVLVVRTDIHGRVPGHCGDRPDGHHERREHDRDEFGSSHRCRHALWPRGVEWASP